MVGDGEKAVLAWLGHPIAEITEDEFTILADYVERAEKAKQKGKPTPYLPPKSKKKPARKR